MPESNFQNLHLDSSPFLFPGGDTGVLLIHGFTATPTEVRLVGGYLQKRGYTVSGPRLPGHGTTVKEINRCSWQDWADHVARAYDELRSRCTRVFVGGESMGGLLALYLGIERPEIAGLIIYAPAMRLANRWAWFSHLLKFFVKKVEKNRRSDDPDAIVDQRWQGYTVDPIPAVAQLLILQRRVRRRLPEIEQPLIVFQGRLDATLDLRGAEEVVDKVSSIDKDLVWMEESVHCLILDQEWEAAAQRTLAFIQRLERTAG